MKYFITGGKCQDKELTIFKNEEKYGPYDSYEEALKEWKQLSYKHFDDHFTIYKISSEN